MLPGYAVLPPASIGPVDSLIRKLPRCSHDRGFVHPRRHAKGVRTFTPEILHPCKPALGQIVAGTEFFRVRSRQIRHLATCDNWCNGEFLRGSVAQMQPSRDAHLRWCPHARFAEDRPALQCAGVRGAHARGLPDWSAASAISSRAERALTPVCGYPIFAYACASS